VHLRYKTLRSADRYLSVAQLWALQINNGPKYCESRSPPVYARRTTWARPGQLLSTPLRRPGQGPVGRGHPTSPLDCFCACINEGDVWRHSGGLHVTTLRREVGCARIRQSTLSRRTRSASSSQVSIAVPHRLSVCRLRSQIFGQRAGSDDIPSRFLSDGKCCSLCLRNCRASRLWVLLRQILFTVR